MALGYCFGPFHDKYFDGIKRKKTFDFVCILTESKDCRNISMDLRYGKRTMTYRQRMTELKRIIPEASKEFDFDSLRS